MAGLAVHLVAARDVADVLLLARLAVGVSGSEKSVCDKENFEEIPVF